MRGVRQKDPEGCGVAVYAMLVGTTYARAAKELGFMGEPITPGELRRALEREGFFVRTVSLASEVGDVWPPRPFAPQHFAVVTAPTGRCGHFLAMDEIGVVRDPLSPRKYKLSDWDVVHEVTGVC